MKNCRRSKIALVAIAALTFLGYTKGMDVGMAISTIAMGIAGANAYEKKGNNETTKLQSQGKTTTTGSLSGSD